MPKRLSKPPTARRQAKSRKKCGRKTRAKCRYTATRAIIPPTDHCQRSTFCAGLHPAAEAHFSIPQLLHSTSSRRPQHILLANIIDSRSRPTPRLARESRAKGPAARRRRGLLRCARADRNDSCEGEECSDLPRRTAFQFGFVHRVVFGELDELPTGHVVGEHFAGFDLIHPAMKMQIAADQP